MSEFHRLWEWLSSLEGNQPKPIVVPPTPVDDSAEPASPRIILSDDVFEPTLVQTLRWEGGKDDDPQDPGGRTAYGITQHDWDTWCTEHDHPRGDVWDLTPDLTKQVYLDHYWLPIDCADYHPAVANCLFDYDVNSGQEQAIKDAQRVIGVTPDGIYGPRTHAALVKAVPFDFVTGLSNRRMALLRGLATWPRFGRGWSERVAGVKAYSLSLIK